MKTFFQTTFFTADQKEVWNKPEEINFDQVKFYSQVATREGKASYFAMQFRQNNLTFYPFVFIDIDSNDLKKSQQSATKIIIYLESLGLKKEDFYTCFSGNKGFHIFVDARLAFEGSVPTSESFPIDIQSKLVKKIAAQCLSQDDVQPDYKVYSKRRMVRSIGSKHLKSGLSKTLITRDELFGNVEIIKELATKPSPYPSGVDDSLSFFIGNSRTIKTLSEIIDDVKGENPVTVKAKKTKKATVETKTHTVSQYNTSSSRTMQACRALRQLTNSTISTSSVDLDKRLVFAGSLYDTDLYSDTIHEIFSKTSGYNRDLTGQHLKRPFGSSNCEELIKIGFCKERCNRYVKIDGEQSLTPSYFGTFNDMANWFKYTEPSYITGIAQKLIDYHKTTTDVFDWANCQQYLESPDVYSIAISDIVRKQSVPLNGGMLIQVKKSDSKFRDLVKIHFESELISSLFVERGLISNKAFKKNKVLAQNVHSFGYQDSDGTGRSLIRPWFEEYSAFKSTLRNISSQNEYQFVYSDDIKNFYPSFSREHINRLCTEMYNDPRVVITLEKIFSQSLKHFQTGQTISKDIGLPQGPLIAHVIASRLLLKIDEYVSSKFNIEELLLVRYCDDLVFFCKDEKALRKLKDEVVPEIEKRFFVQFHKNEGSEKTVSTDIETYREGRLENDLFKYQIKFESELNKADPEAKKQLFELLSNVFGSTLERFLSNDSQINPKELERTLTSIRWRIPALLKEPNDLLPMIENLAEKIIKFLDNEIISFKLRTNLALLLLNLVEAAGDYSPKILEVVVNFLSSNTSPSSRQNVIIQLLREIVVTDTVNLKKLASHFLHSYTPNNLEFIEAECLKELTYVTKRIAGGSEFSFDIWPDSPQGSPANLSKFVKNCEGIERMPERFEELCQKSESDFMFYLSILNLRLSHMKQELDLKTRYKFYDIAFRYSLIDLKMIFLIDADEFASAGLTSESQRHDLSTIMNVSHVIIKDSFNEQGSDFKIRSNVGKNVVYHVGESDYLIEFTRSNSLRGVNPKRLADIIQRINSLKELGEMKAVVKGSQLIIAYKFPSSGDVTLYLDRSNRSDEIVEAEKHFFLAIERAGHRNLPIVALSAKNLGLQKVSASRKIVIVTPTEVINDTNFGIYTLNSGRIENLNKPSGFMLPGRRIIEFANIANLNPERNFPYGLVGWSFLDVLRTNHKAAVYYKTAKAVHNCLSKIEQYGAWIALDPSNREIDRIKYSSFNLFRKLYKKQKLIVRRQQSKPFTPSSYHLLTICREILELSKIFHGSELIRIEKLLTDLAISHKDYAWKHLKSIDVITGYSLVWIANKASVEAPKEYRLPLALVGVVGLYHLTHALNEIKIRFGIMNSEFLKTEVLIESKINELQRDFKANYLIPDLSNGETLTSTFISSSNEILKQMRSLKSDRDLYLLKIKKSPTFNPYFSTDKTEKLKEISTNFHRIKISVPVEVSTPSQFIIAYVRKKFNLPGLSFGEDYLSVVLSSQHSWRAESDMDINEYGMITACDEKFMLSAYPKNLRLYPQHIEKRVRLSVKYYVVFGVFGILGTILYLILKNILLPILFKN